MEQVQSPAVLKQAPKTFSTAGLVVSRHEAISIDGERIPYVQVGPAGETGDAPVHLTGYGGFRIAELPYYISSIGKLWLERGGTSVRARSASSGSSAAAPACAPTSGAAASSARAGMMPAGAPASG
jgi:prolyl oligopeptidase